MSHKEELKGGVADGIDDKSFAAGALRKGMGVEKEHTKSKKLQKEIAKDHLAEDPKYYDKLEKMEKSAGLRETLKSFFDRIKSARKASNVNESVEAFKRVRQAGLPAGFSKGFQSIKEKK